MPTLGEYVLLTLAFQAIGAIAFACYVVNASFDPNISERVFEAVFTFIETHVYRHHVQVPFITDAERVDEFKAWIKDNQISIFGLGPELANRTDETVYGFIYQKDAILFRLRWG